MCDNLANVLVSVYMITVYMFTVYVYMSDDVYVYVYMIIYWIVLRSNKIEMYVLFYVILCYVTFISLHGVKNFDLIYI